MRQIQPTTHRCWHPNAWPRRGQHWRGFCKHDVLDEGGYRFFGQHRKRLTEDLWQITHGFPTFFPGVPYNRQPEGPGRFSQLKRPRASWEHDGIPPYQVNEAIRVAKQYAEDPKWRQEVQCKAEKALGGHLYRRSRSRSTLKMCKRLANEAAFLLTCTDRAERAIEKASSPLLRWIGNAKVERFVARKFAQHVTAAAGSVKLITVARALQCYGVFICAADNKVDWLDCHCLRPLAKSRFKETIQNEVREVVGRGFDGIIV